MEVPTNCIACGSIPEEREINSLPIRLCHTCGLMWRTSFNVPLSHYSEKDPSFSSEKEKLQRRNIAHRIRQISRYMDLNDTCDVGGSKGYFVDALRSSGFSNVYGIDPNTIEVAAAQKRGTPMEIGSTAEAAALFKKFGTKNATLFHVIEHLPDPKGDVRSLYEALPSGGCLVIETPDFSAYSFRKVNYLHKLVYPEHLFYFSPTNISLLLKNQGFETITILHRDFDPYHLNFREALFRLGLLQKDTRSQKRKLDEGPSAARKPEPARAASQNRISGYVRSGIEFLLSALVVLSGRQNFMLVIARKP